jgi:hypothetical protein
VFLLTTQDSKPDQSLPVGKGTFGSAPCSSINKLLQTSWDAEKKGPLLV